MKYKKNPIKIGERFGKLTIIAKLLMTSESKNRFFIAKCDCGNIKRIRGNAFRSGNTKSCGCLAIKPDGEASYNHLYGIYKRNARKRKIEFKLSIEEFKQLVNGNCHYCNSIPREFNRYYKINKTKMINQTTDKTANRAWIKINGIDRINSSDSYIFNNCVPCCSQCNQAKMDYSIIEFKDWAIKLAENLKKVPNV